MVMLVKEVLLWPKTLVIRNWSEDRRWKSSEPKALTAACSTVIPLAVTILLTDIGTPMESIFLLRC